MAESILISPHGSDKLKILLLSGKEKEEELKRRVENINLERMEEMMDKKINSIKPKRKPKTPRNKTRKTEKNGAAKEDRG